MNGKLMPIKSGQPTGLYTKFNYYGGGQEDIFEGQAWLLPDGKSGKVRWNGNKGMWCLQIDNSGIKIPLYKVINIIEKSK